MQNPSYTVNVFSINGDRLNNCKPARARLLLKRGNAKVISKGQPFAIQLLKKENQEVSISPQWK